MRGMCEGSLQAGWSVSENLLKTEGAFQMEQLLMALDQGTTSSRCILFDSRGQVCSCAQKEYRQFYPKPGWVEQDAMEIWSTQIGVALEAMLKVNRSARDIAAIGITNQRETVVVWERETATPICNAIVWQCRRTAGMCKQLKAQGYEPMFHEKTGLILDAYFSATKLKWILDNIPGSRERAQRGELLFGTVDSWLIYKLTGGKVHATDYSNAARTMLFNIHTLDWDEDILRLLEIPRQMLPQIKPSSGIFGECDASVFGVPVPIGGAAGDQQSALFGQACFERGDAKNTYGTGCFLLMNTGDTPVESHNGLLTTIAWGLGDKVTYALEGSIFVAGAAVQWLRDELDVLDSSGDSEYMASKVPDTGGVYLVPAFVGLGAPYWDPYARGTIVGLTRGSNKYHIIRATLESVAYQTRDILLAMQEDSGATLHSLKVDGGASANNLLMQFQADIIESQVYRPRCIETTALGAACLAGLAVGVFEDLSQIRRIGQVERKFIPDMDADRRRELVDGWKRAVQRSMGWARE